MGRRSLILVGLSAALVVVGLLGAAVGSTAIDLSAVVNAILQGLRGEEADVIVWQLRLPRVAMAVAVGAALGMSGAAYQGLFRNPLADPFLMGAAAGAACGATIALTIAGSIGGAQPEAWVPIFSFIGALLAVALAITMAGGVGNTHDLILAGVVVGAILTGITTALMLRDSERVLHVLTFTLGNLAFSSWEGVGVLGVYLVIGIPPLLLLHRTLNALQLGEAVAGTLGLPLGALKLTLIAAATLITAASVAEVGIIGFVGLIVPHALRKVGGGDYGWLLPASALGGGVLMVLADLAARTLIRPAELPVGVVTTLLGGPFFLYLLKRGRDGR